MRITAVVGLMSIVFLHALSLHALADDARLSFGKGEPLPGMNALFQQKEGWIGADGAHSVLLSAPRTEWSSVQQD